MLHEIVEMTKGILIILSVEIVTILVFNSFIENLEKNVYGEERIVF